MKRFFFALLFVFSSCLIALAQKPTLESKIKQLAESHKGKIAIAVKALDTGESYNLNENEVMQTASLIKLAIMAATYQWADDKKIDLNKTMILTKEDKVQGAGILTDHFSDGATFSLRDTIRLMIRYSDNTATNMVIDEVGLKGVNDWTKSKGLAETRINGKVFKGARTTLDPDRLKKYQLGSTSCAETIKLLEMIHEKKAASPAYCDAMIEHLKANDDHEILLKYLPEGFIAAHKTGATNKVRTDAGIFYVPTNQDKKKVRPIAICVLTNENEDVRWVKENQAEVTLGKIGLAIVDHFRE